MAAKSKFKLKDAWIVLSKTYVKWIDDNIPLQSAGISFFALISMVPLTVLIIVIADQFLGQPEVQQRMFTQIRELTGERTANAFRTLIESVREPRSDAAATVFGILTLIFGASHVFIQIRYVFKIVWQMESEGGFGVMNYLRERSIAFATVTLVGIFLLVLLISSAGMVAFGEPLKQLFPETIYYHLLKFLNILIPFLLIMPLFAVSYKYLPRVKVAWRDIWPGALVGAVLFSAGRLAVGWFLSHSRYSSAFGIAGSIIIILIWIYFSAQVYFFGAEMIQVFAVRYGSRRGKKK